MKADKFFLVTNSVSDVPLHVAESKSLKFDISAETDDATENRSR